MHSWSCSLSRPGATERRPPLSCGEEQLTYRQLDDQSHDLALYLQAQGVGPTVWSLSAWKGPRYDGGTDGNPAGRGAYLPLDPDYPDERLAYMLQDSQTAIVLAQEKLTNKQLPC